MSGAAAGRVAGLYSVPRPRPAGILPFVTAPVETMALDFSGIPGDPHAGATRRAGPRDKWLPRGTIIRNDRQLSAVCPIELAAISARLDIAELRPEWLGANLLIAGLSDLSALATGSRLAIGGQWGGKGRFDGTAVLRVEAYNDPCRRAGRAIAQALERAELQFAFVKAARELRGLVLSVDLPGVVAVSDTVVIVPPHGIGR